MKQIQSTREQLENLTGTRIPSTELDDPDSTKEQVNYSDAWKEDIDYPLKETEYDALEQVDKRLISRLWRLNNLYTVINEDGEKVNFELRKEQLYLLLNMHQRNLILKARQLGMTTFVVILYLDFALFNKNKRVGLIADKKENAQSIFKKIQTAWRDFPDELKKYLKLDTTSETKSSYEFNNGSEIKIGLSLRSGTYQALHVTEYGIVSQTDPKKADEIKNGAFTAAKRGVHFVESTAKGEGGNFHKKVKQARKAKKRGYELTEKDDKFFFFPWYFSEENKVEGDLSERMDRETKKYLTELEQEQKINLSQEQKNWYYLEKRSLQDNDTKGDMKKENPSTPEEAFSSSRNPVFDYDILDRHKEKYVCKPIRRFGVDNRFLQFKKYKSSHRYGLGADVAQGVKKDSSAIVIIDFTKGETVLTYENNQIDPVKFAEKVKQAAVMYGSCVACVERNDNGVSTNVRLNKIYSNIYTEEKEGKLETKKTQKLGIRTSGANKSSIIYQFKQAVNNMDIKLLDETLIEEAKDYDKGDLNNSKKGRETRHFDLVTAAAIAYQTKSHADFSDVDIEQKRQIEKRRKERLSNAQTSANQRQRRTRKRVGGSNSYM